jgi:hypothetical protein
VNTPCEMAAIEYRGDRLLYMRRGSYGHEPDIMAILETSTMFSHIADFRKPALPMVHRVDPTPLTFA